MLLPETANKAKRQTYLRPEALAKSAALEVAEHAHSGQYMKAKRLDFEKVSYVDGHLLEMVAISQACGISDPVLAAILLHDSIEDSDKQPKHHCKEALKDGIKAPNDDILAALDVVFGDEENSPYANKDANNKKAAKIVFSANKSNYESVVEAIYIAREAASESDKKHYDALLEAANSTVLNYYGLPESTKEQKFEYDKVDSAEKLKAKLIASLSELGYPKNELNAFAEKVVGIVVEDTNLQKQLEAKRVSQVEAAKTRSTEAKIVKQIDEIHHLISAIEHPPHDWSYKKRFSTIFKAIEVGKANSTGNKLLDTLIITMGEVAMASAFSDTSLLSPNTKVHLSAIIEEVKDKHRDYEEIIPTRYAGEIKLDSGKGIGRILVDKNGMVVGYGMYVNPLEDHRSEPNHDAELMVLMQEYNGAHSWLATGKPLFARVGDLIKETKGGEDIVITDTNEIDRAEQTGYIRMYHLTAPITMRKFMDIAENLEFPISPEVIDQYSSEFLKKDGGSAVALQSEAMKRFMENPYTPPEITH